MGRTPASNLGIRYFDVKQHLLDYIRAQKIDGDDLPNQGFDIEELEIRAILENEPALVFEATGSSEYFLRNYKMYTKVFNDLPIKLVGSYETYRDRTYKRDLADNFVVSTEVIRRIYDLSVLLELDWFQVINTENDISANETLKELEMVLGT